MTPTDGVGTNIVVSEARIESWNPAVALKLAPLVARPHPVENANRSHAQRSRLERYRLTSLFLPIRPLFENFLAESGQKGPIHCLVLGRMLVIQRLSLVDLVHTSGLLRIFQNKSFSLDALLEQLSFRDSNAPHSEPLTQDQPPGDNELLLINRYNQLVVLFPGFLSPRNGLPDWFVDNFHLLTPGINLQLRGLAVDLLADDDFANLVRSRVRS